MPVTVKRPDHPREDVEISSLTIGKVCTTEVSERRRCWRSSQSDSCKTIQCGIQCAPEAQPAAFVPTLRCEQRAMFKEITNGLLVAPKRRIQASSLVFDNGLRRTKE